MLPSGNRSTECLNAEASLSDVLTMRRFGDSPPTPPLQAPTCGPDPRQSLSRDLVNGGWQQLAERPRPSGSPCLLLHDRGRTIKINRG